MFFVSQICFSYIWFACYNSTSFSVCGDVLHACGARMWSILSTAVDLCSGCANLITDPKKPKGKMLFSNKFPVAAACSPYTFPLSPLFHSLLWWCTVWLWNWTPSLKLWTNLEQHLTPNPKSSCDGCKHSAKQELVLLWQSKGWSLTETVWWGYLTWIREFSNLKTHRKMWAVDAGPNPRAKAFLWRKENPF